MEIMSTYNKISLIDSVKTQNPPMTVKQNTVQSAKNDSFSKRSAEDTFNGKNVNKKKIITYSSIGMALAAFLVTAIDFKFAEGRHLKKIWGKLTGHTPEVKPKTNKSPNIGGKSDIGSPDIKSDITLPKQNADVEASKLNLKEKNPLEIDKQVKDYFENEQKELIEAKNFSDYKNERWLNEQHHIKERDYSDFWNSELEKIERPIQELRKKEAEKLSKIIDEEYAKFYELHKNEIPSEEVRYKAYLPLMRTEYGSSFEANASVAKLLAKDPNNWIVYLWNKTPKAKELQLEHILKQMEPKDLEMYNSAAWVLDNKKLQYDKLDLASSIFEGQREIIEKIATTGRCYGYGEVLGHNKAYTINSALRLGYNVDDTLKVILDEGFRTVEPLDRSVTVYRHVCGGKADNSIDFINKLIKAKKGDTFIDKGYSYSSYSEKGASSCNGILDLGTDEVKLTILVPEGARVSNGSHYEQNELLFPRNAEFRVIEEASRPEPIVFRHDDGSEFKIPQALRMTLEYVLPENSVK